MKKMNTAVTKYVFSGKLILLLAFGLFLSVNFTRAQDAKSTPEMSVAGVWLNDETSAKAFLANYSARRDEKNRPVYYFYNKHGNQVMRLTAFSEAKPYLLVAAEVFTVGLSYKDRHYVLNEVISFPTESGFHVGEQQTAKSLLFAIRAITTPKDVLKKKGANGEVVKQEKKQTITYKLDAAAFAPVADKKKIADYTAVYEFSGKMMKRFKFEIELVP